MKKFNLKFICDLIVILFCITFTAKFYSLSANGVLDSYPFISSDGFDWYTEGIYLFKSITHGVDYPLPILRPPLFVIICSLDYALGQVGYFLGFIYGINIFILYKFTCKIIILLNNKINTHYLYPLIILSCTVLPINYIRPYLLADEIAITLSVVSVYYFILGRTNSCNRCLIIGSLIGLLGGLTQTYAMIPIFTISISYTLLDYINRKTFNKKYLFISLVLLLIYLFITYFWRSYIQHISTPNNFNLLAIDFKMTNFYLNTWTILFFPFILFKLFSYKLNINSNENNLSIALIILFFSILSYFYHWPESRFTAYYWIWTLILFLGVAIFNKAQGLLAIIIFIASIFVVPDNYWNPNINLTSISYKKSWIYQYFASEEASRAINNCSNIDCSSNLFLKNSDDYVKGTINIYNKLKNLDHK